MVAARAAIKATRNYRRPSPALKSWKAARPAVTTAQVIMATDAVPAHIPGASLSRSMSATGTANIQPLSRTARTKPATRIPGTGSGEYI